MKGDLLCSWKFILWCGFVWLFPDVDVTRKSLVVRRLSFRLNGSGYGSTGRLRRLLIMGRLGRLRIIVVVLYVSYFLLSGAFVNWMRWSKAWCRLVVWCGCVV